MATQSKAITRPDSLAKAPMAMALLLTDPKRVAELVAACDRANAHARKDKFVAQFRMELNVADEPGDEIDEIFYPALSAGAGAR